jgi:hypothetical protein
VKINARLRVARPRFTSRPFLQRPGISPRCTVRWGTE